MEEYIYILSDPRTGDVKYVGKTVNIKKRYYNHCSLKTSNKSGNKQLVGWIANLLMEKLKPEITIIDKTTNGDCGQLEIYWIEQFRQWEVKLYNITIGGDGRPSGYKYVPKESVKIKHSIFMKNLNRDIWKKIYVKYNLDGDYIRSYIGAKELMNEEKIAKSTLTKALKHGWELRGFQYRCFKSIENIPKKVEKASLKLMGYDVSAARKLGKGTRIYMYSMDNILIKTFNSVKECSEELNLKYSTILARIHKNIKKDFILTNKVL